MFLSYPIRPLSVSLWNQFITTVQFSTCSLGFSLEFQDQDVQALFFEEKADFVSVQAQFMEENVDPVFIYKLEQG
jgi:hypothetical protein